MRCGHEAAREQGHLVLLKSNVVLCALESENIMRRRGSFNALVYARIVTNRGRYGEKRTTLACV
jgi:hypothetical protein